MPSKKIISIIIHSKTPRLSPPIFVAGDNEEEYVPTTKEFSRLGEWFQTCLSNPCFVETRKKIRDALLGQKAKGRFAAVRDDVDAHRGEYKWKYV